MRAHGRPRCRAQLYLFSYRDTAGALTGAAAGVDTHAAVYKDTNYSEIGADATHADCCAHMARTRPHRVAQYLLACWLCAAAFLASAARRRSPRARLCAQHLRILPVDILHLVMVLLILELSEN